MQDAVIREQLGRLSTLGVTLLDLPPEVAAAYAVPDGVAGGAAVLGGASTSAGAFAEGRGGNSELQRLLHENTEIDMSAALAIIHREHTGGKPAAVGSSAGTSRDDGFADMPAGVSVASSSMQTEPSRPPTLGRWTKDRAERLGGPTINQQLPVTEESLGKTFSFPRPPRNPTATQPMVPSLSPRRQPSAEPAGVAAAPLVAPLRSQDSEATAAARALMSELSGSEDESEVPRAGGGWLGGSRTKKPQPGQYEAELQRQQAERERQRAQEQRNAAATAAAAVAVAAAVDADGRREHQRQGEERTDQERVRAEAAARDEADRRAEAQRAREAATIAEEREARAAAPREAEKAAAHQREAASAAEQARHQAVAADHRSLAVREVESDFAQAAAMDRATEHAADVADVQVLRVMLLWLDVRRHFVQ